MPAAPAHFPHDEYKSQEAHEHRLVLPSDGFSEVDPLQGHTHVYCENNNKNNNKMRANKLGSDTLDQGAAKTDQQSKVRPSLLGVPFSVIAFCLLEGTSWRPSLLGGFPCNRVESGHPLYNQIWITIVAGCITKLRPAEIWNSIVDLSSMIDLCKWFKFIHFLIAFTSTSTALHHPNFILPYFTLSTHES